MRSESPENQPIPCLIQGGSFPAFRCKIESDHHLDCRCGRSRLIERYRPDCFVRVAIQCFECGEVTETPTLPPGEVLPRPLLTFGDIGSYFLGATVEYDPQIAMTCDSEIARSSVETSPRFGSSPFSLSEAGLDSLAAIYDELSGGKLQSQTASVSRARSAGNAGESEFAFVWALHTLRECIGRSVVDLDDPATLTALMWLHSFNHVHSTWSHHPRYWAVARGMTNAKSFVHTLTQFIVAGYLHRVGNRIGLGTEDNAGKPNPDLYFRLDPSQNMYLEVKAPSFLAWGAAKQLTEEFLRSEAKKHFKRKTQISRSHHGLLVYASSILHPDVPGRFEALMRNHLRTSGRERSGLAGMVAVFPTDVRYVQSEGGAHFSCEFTVRVARNEHYSGPAQFSTEPPARAS